MVIPIASVALGEDGGEGECIGGGSGEGGRGGGGDMGSTTIPMALCRADTETTSPGCTYSIIIDTVK